MPYIDPARRRVLGEEGLSTTPGDIAYLVYREMLHYVNYTGVGVNFSIYAAARGAVELALNEFYERHVKPYEEKKREENGDVRWGG